MGLKNPRQNSVKIKTGNTAFRDIFTSVLFSSLLPQRPNWKRNEFKIILKLPCQSEEVSMTQLYLDKLKTGRTRLQVKKHEKKKANHKNKHEANIALYTINNIQPQHRKKRSISQQLSFNKSTKADFIIFMSFRSW